MQEIQSQRPFEQFVLLAAAELSIEGETPVQSYQVTETIEARLDDLDRDLFGGVERQEVVSALSALAQADLLSTERIESATGKGRPAYDAAVGVETILSALADADDVGPYAERLQATA
jgi:predicted transcriptional regulator